MFSFQKRERNLCKTTLEVYNVTTLEVYNVKTLEVYTVKTLEVFCYQIFTGGDMLIIPNMELM